MFKEIEIWQGLHSNDSHKFTKALEAFVCSLERGSLRESVQRAHDCFEKGIDPNNELLFSLNIAISGRRIICIKAVNYETECILSLYKRLNEIDLDIEQKYGSAILIHESVIDELGNFINESDYFDEDWYLDYELNWWKWLGDNPVPKTWFIPPAKNIKVESILSSWHAFCRTKHL